MQLHRRALIGAPFLFALARCGAPSTPSTSSALISAVAAGQTIVAGFLQEAPIINQLAPSILPGPALANLTNSGKSGILDIANAGLIALSADLARGVPDTSGASILDTIEGYFNTALADVGPILTIAAPIVPGLAEAQAIVRDASLALPLIEDFIASILPAAKNASLRIAKARAAGVPLQGLPPKSPSQALADLRLRLGGK